MRLGLAFAGSFALLSLGVTNVGAEGRPPAIGVAYAAPVGCPEQDRFLDALRARLEAVEIGAAPRSTADAVVDLVPSENGFSGRLEVRRPSGRYARELHAGDCETLSSALSFILALALAGEVEPPEPPAEAVPSGPRPAPEAPSEPLARRWRGWVQAEAGLRGGIAPGWPLTEGLSVALLADPHPGLAPSMRVGVLRAGPNVHEQAAGWTELSLLAGRLEVCPATLRVAPFADVLPCGGVALEQLRVSGHPVTGRGYDVDGVSTSLLLGLGLWVRPTSWLALTVQADLMRSLAPARIAFENPRTQIYDVPAYCAAARLGIAARAF